MPGFVFVDFVGRSAAETAFANLSKINFGLHFKSIQVEYARPDPHRQETTQVLEKDRQPPEPIAPSLGVNYPANPHLRYQYPDPAPDIIKNITHALMSVPRLYIQTLHLMNKMNLTPPFGPIKKEYQPKSMKKRKQDELLASDESELEEQEKDTSKEQEMRVREARQMRIAAEKQRLVLKKAKAHDPIQQIQHKCLDSQELAKHPAFRNYDPGTPSTRLYIKNLSKKATEHELSQIYSVFSKDVNVDLMRKGKLKDQAFVNFSDEKTAKLALESTNGYVLHDRPMAVLFSKSK
ncbi:hypothetical protein BY458DRAFT_532918 [Sporodiniella umbellata]|nr:hypothetical protein BY458DRAFT_532918 [Sporodiniella umbellata]